MQPLYSFVVIFVTTLCIQNTFGMTRAQLKNSGKLLKKTCMPKHDVTEGMYVPKFWTHQDYYYAGSFLAQRIAIAIQRGNAAGVLDQVGKIEQGKFIQEKEVMCYIACIYSVGGAIKNNKVTIDAMVKQVDMMFPAEMKEPVKAAIDYCKGTAKKYKDLCEASYYTAKCLYDFDPANFVFP